MKALPLPTAELCEEYGFIPLTPENCPMEIEVNVKDAVNFISDIGDGKPTLVQYTFHHDEKGALLADCVQMTFHTHGYNRAVTGGPLFPWMVSIEGRGGYAFSLLSEPPPDSGKPIRMWIEYRPTP